MISESCSIAEDFDKKIVERITLMISKEGEHGFMKKFRQKDAKKAITEEMVKNGRVQEERRRGDAEAGQIVVTTSNEDWH
ncbi:hypothetical protein PanWU01x14_349690 [Parasponia andersonii]|uniref:Uncharacterized protein n=1 Tax=Parasponia andersonii TaxID=3476 RepID=A0A2P5AB70_PARAD|nr:hypothetical protein PanWU01x14_349690 [Parasponia andersonii]